MNSLKNRDNTIRIQIGIIEKIKTNLPLLSKKKENHSNIVINGKQFCNLLERTNQRQSESLMLKEMMSDVTINLNILSNFMKDKVVSNLNRTLIVTMHHTIEKIS